MKPTALSLILATQLTMSFSLDAEARSCSPQRNDLRCDEYITSVSAEAIKPITCRPDNGSILVTVSSPIIGSLGDSSITFTATAPNQAPKEITLPNPVTSNSEGKIFGVFSGLPNGTYSITTTFKQFGKGITCIFICNNIKIKNSNCQLLACCSK